MRFFSFVFLLFLGAIASNAQIAPSFPDPFSQLSYWAPGIVNPEAGAVEMDVRFLGDRASLSNDYQNIFVLPGNGGPGTGITLVSMIFAPPQDGRDFSTVIRGLKSYTNITGAAPAWSIGPEAKPSRLVVTWGGGQAQVWFDGKLIGREKFIGAFPLLPERFRSGYGLDSGRAGAYRLQALRISDAPLPEATLAAPAPLVADEHTTFLASEGLTKLALPVTSWQKQSYQSGVFLERYASRYVTPEGQPLSVPLRLVNYTAKAVEYTLQVRVRNREGKEIAAPKYPLTVPADSRYTSASISLPKIDVTGYYEATLAVIPPAGAEVAYDFAFVVQPQETLKPGKLADYLGHHDRFTVKPDFFSQLGIRWHRMWARDRGMHWCVVEPTQGQFFWEAADASVATARAQGVEVLGVLGYPPAWASTYSPAERDRLKLPNKRGRNSNTPERYQPRNLEEWKKYVRAVVGRYHDRVKYWEIYNEVDFHPPAMHATFSGSTQDYFDLLKSAYEIIKEIDPSCQMMTAGFSLSKGITDCQMPIDLLALGAGSYFDIFAVHGYADLGTLAETTKAVRAAKPTAPFWMTEYMFEAPADDYGVVVKAFWFLDQGYEKYFLHGGELDRNYGELKITPFYAVAAELARQMRFGEKYLGPAEGTEGKFRSWRFKRSDGSYLNVFAVDNGTVSVTLAGPKKETSMRVTGLYGDTLSQGSYDLSKPLEFSSLVYIVSADDLKITKVVRHHGNIVVNPGFEMREGDYLTDETLARPVGWDLRPGGVPPSAMSFVPGRVDKYALKLATSGGIKAVYTGQVVMLDVPGAWTISADVKVKAGSTGVLLFKQNQNGIWKELVRQNMAGTGDWKTISARMEIKGENSRGVLLFGLESEGSAMEIDQVNLQYAPPEAASP